MPRVIYINPGAVNVDEGSRAVGRHATTDRVGLWGCERRVVGADQVLWLVNPNARSRWRVFAARMEA